MEKAPDRGFFLYSAAAGWGFFLPALRRLISTKKVISSATAMTIMSAVSAVSSCSLEAAQNTRLSSLAEKVV